MVLILKITKWAIKSGLLPWSKWAARPVVFFTGILVKKEKLKIDQSDFTGSCLLFFTCKIRMDLSVSNNWIKSFKTGFKYPFFQIQTK